MFRALRSFMRQKLRAVLLVGGLIVSARSAAAEDEPVTSEIPLCQSAPDDCVSTFHVLLGVGGGTGVGGRAAVSGVYWVFRHFGIGADAGGAAVTTLFPGMGERVTRARRTGHRESRRLVWLTDLALACHCRVTSPWVSALADSGARQKWSVKTWVAVRS
jgi:hypothetical protein